MQDFQNQRMKQLSQSPKLEKRLLALLGDFRNSLGTWQAETSVLHLNPDVSSCAPTHREIMPIFLCTLYLMLILYPHITTLDRTLNFCNLPQEGTLHRQHALGPNYPPVLSHISCLRRALSINFCRIWSSITSRL